jgi:TP53 regulating kinase-like protein
VEDLTLIAKGAEANLWLDQDWNGLKVLVKKRGEKKYRHPELDAEIRRSRTIREASIIHRAKEAGVLTPLIYQVDVDEAAIVMEYVDGRKVRDIVADLDKEERVALFRSIGESAGRLHRAGIIHGDLTTSNIIESSGRVVFIDFGLAEVSTETEKRGVDLNLMHRMLTSTHFTHIQELFSAFREGYLTTLGIEGEEALNRMEEVSRRGRYVERG